MNKSDNILPHIDNRFLLFSIFSLLLFGILAGLIVGVHHAVVKTNQIMFELTKMNTKLDQYLEKKIIREITVDGYLSTNRERIKETWEFTQEIKRNKCFQQCFKNTINPIIIHQNQQNTPTSSSIQTNKALELNIGKNVGKK